MWPSNACHLSAKSLDASGGSAFLNPDASGVRRRCFDSRRRINSTVRAADLNVERRNNYEKSTTLDYINFFAAVCL